MSFDEKKEGAAAIEEKEGKDADGKPAPEPDSVQASDMSPELHGKTANEEACRCLPNSVKPPKASWMLRKGAGGKANNHLVRRQIYRERLDQVESGTRPELDAVYKAERQRDWAFEDLHAAHLRTEEEAKMMKEAFAEVKDAYSEGDCLGVKEKAEENGEEVPECHKNYEKAAKEMKEIRSLIAPRCKVGAITLRAMQPPRAPAALEENLTESSFPLPPDLLASTLTAAGAARCWEPSPQKRTKGRAQRTYELHSFL